jgi:hypothetical protein
MKDAILRVENTNIITVNWSQGASGSYEQSIANSQIVGIDLARLINTYVLNGILTYDGIHIVGHSLGAHVAGFAGQLTVLKVNIILLIILSKLYFSLFFSSNNHLFIFSISLYLI